MCACNFRIGLARAQTLARIWSNLNFLAQTWPETKKFRSKCEKIQVKSIELKFRSSQIAIPIGDSKIILDHFLLKKLTSFFFFSKKLSLFQQP